ncbi:MAG TPA: chloride channel protein [Candidatus Polarisedimenticolaceae bacterium]|nr:chloride channel protein [Candidatus Polarisedimenticolaceae bacterium]
MNQFWERRPRLSALPLGEGRWILLSALIGAVAGLGAVAFDLCFRIAQHLFLEGLGGFLPPSAGGEGGAGFGPDGPLRLVLCVVAGALVSGALVYGLAPEAEGHGTDAVLDAFHRKLGKIRRRVPPVKALASAITIGSGGSAGREGPIAQIGAGFGSWLGDVLRLSNQDRRLLMMAGVAGGIGAIFRAPLGATFFAAEVLYGTTDFEYEVLLPGLMAAIVSYSIYASYAGWGFMFAVPPLAYHRPRQLLVYALLGLLCAVVGAIYPRVFYGARDRVFRRLPLPAWLCPAAGACALGALAIFFPQSLGMGYGYVQQAIQGEHTAAFLFGLAFLKILATSLTISSGGSGGVFGPSLVIGGALGGGFGRLALTYLPALAPEPAAAVMVGMGGFFAGVARVPFASVVMVMEMTGSYGLLVPSLLVAAMAFLFVPRGSRLYENQLERRLDSPVHLGSFATHVLRGGRVSDAGLPRPGVTAGPQTPLSNLLELVSSATQSLIPLVDGAGRLVGAVSIEDLRRAMISNPDDGAKPAATLATPTPEPLTPEDDLARAARLIAASATGEVVLVSGEARVLGTFSRRDLIVAYGHALHRLHDAKTDEA